MTIDCVKTVIYRSQYAVQRVLRFSLASFSISTPVKPFIWIANIMAPENTPYGRRLLPLLIDEIAAQDPERPWVSVAKTDNLQDGFQDLSYRRFANAINRMAWWLESSIGKGQNHETLAYIGPPDVRYYVVCLVAVKVGYKVRYASICS